MAETYKKICRICLTNNREDNIADSSCFAKFLIEVVGLKVFDEQLWLCMWCRATLRQAMILFKTALESEKILHSKIQTDIFNKPKSLHSLNFIHNSHIDIPPLTLEYQDYKTVNILEEATNPLSDIQDDEIPLKIKTIKSSNNLNEESISNKEPFTNEEYFSNKESFINKESFTNKESISNKEFPIDESEIETKRKNRKEFDFNELKFEVEYLNLEEQLKEIELKKLKYQDFKFQCNACGLAFSTSDVLEEHNVRHSELSGPHRCSICALHFKSPDVLSQHSLGHKRRFKCLLCGSNFKRWSHCVSHRYKCGGAVEPIACDDCPKIFSNEHTLKIHMKVHRTEKKHCCEQCDRKFGSKQRLTVHMRSHSGIKPFSCPQCARTFTTRSNLRAHSAVHNQTAQFYCVECHTHYKTAKSLKRHFNESAKHVSLKIDMYSCEVCAKRFSTEKSLNCHLSTRHGSEHRCTQCDKSFSNKSNLNKHIKCIHTAK